MKSLTKIRIVVLLAALAVSDAATVRSTGRIEAMHSFLAQVPRLEGHGGRLTLTGIVENGAAVHSGALLAEFDPTDQVRQAREALAKFDDLAHQVDQKRAEQKNNAEKRNSDLIQAQGDLSKAEIELRKGPILSAIDQEKNAIKLADARAHVASLERSNKFHSAAETAELRVLELQRDRQRLALDREKANAARLKIASPINGMVALENTWRGNSMGHALEGDQLFSGESLLRVFDPSTMIVLIAVGEPDGAILKPGAKARVHLDAFPNLSFTAHFDSASPVATSAIGSSVKTFTARFVMDQADAHLLPDLSVAVDIEGPK